MTAATVSPAVRRSAAVLVAALVASLLQLMSPVAAGAAEPEPANLAPTAVAGAQYTAPWNSLAAINDGVVPASPGLGDMWGSYSGDRPEEVWIDYRWTEPVTLSRSVISFWADAPGPGTGDNVWAPESWRLQYLPAGSTDWTDVPGVDTLGVSLDAANATTFPAVTTMAVRALLTASGNADGSSYAALSVTEWEVWGTTAPSVPPSATDPLAIDEVALPVEAGALPTLPVRVWATFTDGVRRELTVTWPAVTDAQVATPGSTVTVSGTAAGVSVPVPATVYVRAVGATPVATTVRPVSALTVAGTAPQLPGTVSVEYDDASVDSRPAVTWDAIPAAAYAAAGVFAVAGAVDVGAGATLPAEALVVVDDPAPTDQPPTVRLTADTDVPSSGWYTGAVRVAATASSPLDDDPMVEVQVDDAAWEPATGPVTVSTDGTHVVRARATDADGRVSEVRELTVRVDSAAPVTIATTENRDEDVVLTLTATDAGSGVASTQYQVGDGFIASYTGSVPITRGAAAQPVRFFSADTAGNVEAAGTVEIPARAADPTAAVTITSADPPTADGWYRQPVLVALTSPSAEQTVQYRVDGGTWRTYSSSILIAGSRVTTIDHRLLESAVVVPGSDAQIRIQLDRKLPTVTATRSPVGGSATPRNPIDVTFGGTDALSGVSRVEYRVNTGDWTAAPAGPVRFDSVGDQVVSARAVDLAGNVSSVRTLTFSVRPDVATTVKPTTRAVRAGDPLTLVLAGFARWDEVTLTVGGLAVGTATTDQNGAARTTVRLPAGLTPGAAPIVATGTDPAITATGSVTVRS